MSARHTVPRADLVRELEEIVSVLASAGKSDAQEHNEHFVIGYARATAARLLERLGRDPNALPEMVEHQQRQQRHREARSQH